MTLNRNQWSFLYPQPSLLRAMLGVALSAGLVGCDRSGDAGDHADPRSSARVTRLLDLRDRMTVRSGESTGRPVVELTFETPGRSLYSTGPDLAALVGREREQPEDGPPPASEDPPFGPDGLWLPNPGLFLHIFKAPGIAALEVELHGEFDSSTELYVIPVGSVMFESGLSDPAILATIQRVRVGGDPYRLEVDEEGVARQVILPSRLSSSYLLVVLARNEPVRATSFRAHARIAYESLLQRPVTRLGSEDVRRVNVDRDHREALVLVTPCEAVIPLDPWSVGSRVGLYLARLDPGPALDVTVSIRKAPADEEVKRTRDGEKVNVTLTEGSGWGLVELDLPNGISASDPSVDLGGADYELVVKAKIGEGEEAMPITLALGSPFRSTVASKELGSSGRGPLAESEQPDVILISLDTVRADRMPPSVGAEEYCPSVTRLAQDSVVFSNAVSSAPWTLPAHASVFSGQYPQRHQASGLRRRMGRGSPHVANALRSAGYETLGFTGGGYVGPDFGLAEGFDRYSTIDLMTRNPRDRELADERLDAMREELEAVGTKPRFFFIHTYIAHNYGPSIEALRAVGASSEQLKELKGSLLSLPLEDRIHTVEGAWGQENSDLLRLVYDAGVWSADRLVGEVLDAIDASGRWDCTVLIVMSDHGEELMDRGAVGHGHSLHRELLHVPLLIRTPETRAAVCSELTSLIDVAPTILALAGLDSNPRHDGRSLVPILAGESVVPRAVVAETRWGGVMQALRSPSYKLIFAEEGGDPTTLYDLRNDADERVDVRSARADLSRRLEVQLQRRVAGLRAAADQAEDAEMDPALEAELRELGYLGGG